MPLALRLFGTFTAAVGVEPVRLPTDKTRALLAYLALTPNTALRRERLAGLLWPDQDEALARQNLRKTLGRLKEALDAVDPALAGRLLPLTKQTIELNGAECAADAVTFRSLLEAAAQHAHPGLAQCAACLERLESAASLYRQGELLAGLSLPDAAPFEEWLLLQRENLRRLHLAALQQLAGAHEQQAAWDKARQYAEWQLEEEPWREEAHRQLMRQYVAQGRRAEALAQYQACRRVLQAELGVDPAPETEALLAQIKAGTAVAVPAPTTAPPPAPAGLRPTTARPWPRLAAPLIGREADITRVIELLAEPACRVVTLTGLGGVGKTSLALAVGERLSQALPPWLAEGVYFVPLAAIGHVSLLPAALAEALGLALNQRQAIAVQVAQHLRHQALLLVLDNFEQLAAEADWLHDLLHACPHLKLLITSREPLNWHGEWRYPLDGLAYPQDETDGADFDAVQLFVLAARQVQPGFAYTAENGRAIGQICRLVYGWPLALQMAAAWVRLMSCDAIAAQVRASLDLLTTTLRHVPERQRSMRVIFDHTWSGLSEEERAILAQLSVFRGGFMLEAAREVAAASPLALSGLADRALVRHDARTGRYSMHELLRQYVGEAADPEAQTAARHTHSRYYLRRLQAEGARLNTFAFQEALEWLKADADNLREAWLWAARSRDEALLADSLAHMAKFFESSGLPQEAVGLFQETLALLETPGSQPPAGLAARLCQHLAESLMNMGQHVEATAVVGAARTAAQGLDDVPLHTQLLFTQALIAREQGRYDEAQALLREASAYSQVHAYPEGVARALHLQGNTYWSMADYAAAQRCYEDGRALYQQLGLEVQASVLTGNIGVVHWRLGQYAEALQNYHWALEAHRNRGDAQKVSVWLGNIGLVYVDLRDDERAMAYLDEALAMHAQLGRKYYQIELLLGKVALYLRRGALDEAGAAHQHALSLAAQIGNHTYLLDCDLWQARLFAARGQTAEALAVLWSLRAREFRADVKATIEQELAGMNGQSSTGGLR